MALFGNKRGMTLSSFVRGVVRALTDGQQAIPHSREDHLKHHMELGEDDIYRPKMVDIELPEGQRISLPKYSLMQVNTLGIHSATVSCSCRIVDIGIADKTSGEMSYGDKHALFYVQPSGSGKRDTFEMKINFTQREPSESENKLIESLDRLVEEKISDNQDSNTSAESDGAEN